VLVRASGLLGRPLAAPDGRLGLLGDLYLDGRTWAVRWLRVETGRWLRGRVVLIAPAGLLPWRPGDGAVRVGVTKARLASAPFPRKGEAVGRRVARALARHFGWPCPASAEGSAEVPADRPPLPHPALALGGAGPPARAGRLHRLAEVTGASVVDEAGPVGTVVDAVLDAGLWVLRYLVTALDGGVAGGGPAGRRAGRRGSPAAEAPPRAGGRLLVPTDWVERCLWSAGRVRLAVSRDRLLAGGVRPRRPLV